MVNNQTACVIVDVITDYDYIYNVIDYEYIASGNNDYDYLRSCNRLQSNMITDYPNPDRERECVCVCVYVCERVCVFLSAFTANGGAKLYHWGMTLTVFKLT